MFTNFLLNLLACDLLKAIPSRFRGQRDDLLCGLPHSSLRISPYRLPDLSPRHAPRLRLLRNRLPSAVFALK